MRAIGGRMVAKVLRICGVPEVYKVPRVLSVGGFAGGGAIGPGSQNTVTFNTSKLDSGSLKREYG